MTRLTKVFMRICPGAASQIECSSKVAWRVGRHESVRNQLLILYKFSTIESITSLHKSTTIYLVGDDPDGQDHFPMLVRLERAVQDIVRYLPDKICFFSEVVWGHGVQIPEWRD